ncbi:hypothetical protein GCM10029964_088410 [Kibdelosporangium lantanae]
MVNFLLAIGFPSLAFWECFGALGGDILADVDDWPEPTLGGREIDEVATGGVLDVERSPTEDADGDEPAGSDEKLIFGFNMPITTAPRPISRTAVVNPVRRWLLFVANIR